MKLWDKGIKIDKKIEQFTVGNDREIDIHLAKYDVNASLAHAKMLFSIGIITAIDYSNNAITCEIPPAAQRPSLTSFILFSKTNSTNINSLTGYYLNAQFRNNSSNSIEMFFSSKI